MLSVGIVGLPNVGKSTLFKALTKNPVDINNYPFCTIDPNVGIVSVLDERLEKLNQISKSKKVIPAIIEFIDIAGLVKGAHKGEGLGNQFLANIRNVDLICHIVRYFPSARIKHVEGSVDPKRDIEIINTELILADLGSTAKKKVKLAKLVRGGDKKAEIALQALEKINQKLDSGKPAKEAILSNEEKIASRDFSLITSKPVLYVLNTSEESSSSQVTLDKDIPFIRLNIKTEEELLDLDPQEIVELKIKSDIAKLSQKAYQILNLITFFTTGEDETRAWTVAKGATAPQAGAKIHNDFKEKFIKAEVVSYADFISAGSYANAHKRGLIRTEGKEYTVCDGDIIIFKI